METLIWIIALTAMIIIMFHLPNDDNNRLA